MLENIFGLVDSVFEAQMIYWFSSLYIMFLILEYLVDPKLLGCCFDWCNLVVNGAIPELLVNRKAIMSASSCQLEHDSWMNKKKRRRKRGMTY